MGDKILKKALQEIINYYQSQGMAGKIGFGNTRQFLLLICKRALRITNLQAATWKVLSTIPRCFWIKPGKSIPIFFFTLAYHSSLVDGGLLVKKVPVLANFLIGSENVELDPRLKRLPDEQIVIKKYASCYHATHLASSLTALQVDTVIITGCITSGCIRATANDSIQYGFRPIIPRECVGDRSAIPHEVSLMDIQARCGDVLPLQDVLDYIDSIAM